MMKGNESDVANIVFEISKWKGSIQILLFYIVFSLDKLLITLSTGYPILMWFASKCSIFKLPESGVENSKLKIFDK